MNTPDLPPDPDADLGELIGACLLAAAAIALALAVVMIAAPS